MNNKYKLLILVISIFFSNPLISQIFDTAYQNEKIKLLGTSPDGYLEFMYFLNNYDKDGIYVGLTKNRRYIVAKIDSKIDSFEIVFNNSVSSLLTYGPLIFKNNNICSSVRISHKVNSSGGYIGKGFDSVYLLKYDLNNNFYINRIPDTVIESYDYLNLFTKEKEYALASLPPWSELDNNKTLNRFRISIIDTLGNVKNSKVFYRTLKNDVLSFEEHGDKLVFSKYSNDISPIGANIYFIDKNSLEITDSIPNRVFPNMKSINDSILIGLTGCQDLYLFITNTNTKSIDTITYSIGEYNECVMPEEAKFDFINTDSIYLCYDVLVGSGSHFFIEILNFNINGDINFRYRFDDIMHQASKQVTGAKATDDGGLIVTVLLLQITGTNISDMQSWLIKFMPNGFVGLTNTETGENESIKVYPNPAKDYINIDIEADNFKSSDVELFDMQGKLVKKSKLYSKTANRIDVSGLNSGAYTYRVVLNGKGISGKVVIGE